MKQIIVDTETGEILEHAVVITTEAPSPKKSGQRGAMVEITCAATGCSNKKSVRRADVKRGWGKYCSKSCAKH